MIDEKILERIWGKEPGRNEPCWCGSGKKYKKCHLGRQRDPVLPAGAQENALWESFKHKQCLHPLAGPQVCNQIISAHTVQRAQTLERIADETNRVCSFYPKHVDSDGGLRLHRIGWKKASTFSGFCAKHDDLTFGPLEKAVFTGTAEQCFLIAYRALCHEVYQKIGALRGDQVMRNIVDRGMPIEWQKAVQESFAVMEAGARAGLADFQALKALMDQQLITKDYSGWSDTIIEFKGDLCVASTGLVSPNRDLDRRELQVLHDADTHQQAMPFGVVATAGGGAVVFAWRANELAPRQFMDSLLKRGKDALPGLLVQFMFAYVENTFFSSAWWSSLSNEDRKHLMSLADISNAYYTDIEYSPSRFVPWEIT